MPEKKFSGHTTVLYHCDCTWEIDYVFQELLRDIMQYARVFYLSSDKLANYKEKHAGDRRVIVFSSSTIACENMAQLLQSFQPHVVFHFSDEFGDRPDYCHLAKLVPVFFHQHTFPTYPSYANMVQIPLGFKAGFLYDTLSSHTKPSTERKFQWSFVGTIKQKSHREEMLQLFQRRFPQSFNMCTDGSMSTKDMGHVYAESVFVPNDRGNVRLDCFRLYEAIFAGAIPVVAGDKKELQETFLFGGPEDFPPFVVGDTWVKSAKICSQLLQPECANQLLDLQQRNRAWLLKHLNQIRSRVGQTAISSECTKS